ncbi:hypothetical protein CRM89_29925 [Nocardia sp. FDAARGOS_372]|uniref:Uncharacterized protein n=2 Tax=Nocardiaceae TaxID=85025 RepID=Q5YM51_NOCFA|nr:hypothetical protein CRM89_29925 [Nocardia sp. FDAARGOS_372]BAD60740.1 hypothetical protein PNF2_540 [Nocardia farcinica IFM 10152]
MTRHYYGAVVEMNTAKLKTLALKVLEIVSLPDTVTHESIDVAVLSTAMETARLNAGMEKESGGNLPDWPLLLGGHVAFMMLRRGNEIVLDPALELRDPRLVALGLTYIEGAALILATLVVETAAGPNSATMEPTTHPAATRDFHCLAEVIPHDDYSAQTAVPALVDVLRRFTIPEASVPDPFSLQSILPPGRIKNKVALLERRINGLSLPTRLAFTAGLAIAGIVAGYLAGSSHGPTENPDIVTATEIALPPGFPETYVGPAVPNVVARVLVHESEQQPHPRMQSVAGDLPDDAFVTGVDHRLRAEIHLGWRDPALGTDQNIELALGLDAGLTITPGTTMLVNDANAAPGIGALQLATTYTPVAMDEEGEIVYQFELAVSSDPALFFCGYNLRPINVLVRDGNSPVLVTAMPVYVLKSCP